MVSVRRRRARGGFTLIELMISMALSTVGLLGLLALQMIAIRGNMMSRNFGEAIGIAQQRLETAGHTTYASLSTLADPGVPCTTSNNVVTGGAVNISPNPDSTTTSTQRIYTRCTSVTVNGDNTTDLSVSVYWNDTAGSLHSVTLVTKRSP
jgi:prepilin-type N-terminal cleavage/methylation domain-containing protein